MARKKSTNNRGNDLSDAFAANVETLDLPPDDPGFPAPQLPKRGGRFTKGPALEIKIPDMGLKFFKILLIGDTPLICNNFNKKHQQEILATHMQQPMNKKAKKVPQEDFLRTLYLNENDDPPELKEVRKATENGDAGDWDALGVFYFPTIAFKNAAVRACNYVKDLTMTYVMGTFHIKDEHTRILVNKATMRQDVVRLSGPRRAPDIRHRAMFVDWRVELTVRYMSSAIDPAQLFNLFNRAGFCCGVGEWRPEKRGQFGMFHVDLGARNILVEGEK